MAVLTARAGAAAEPPAQQQVGGNVEAPASPGGRHAADQERLATPGRHKQHWPEHAALPSADGGAVDDKAAIAAVLAVQPPPERFAGTTLGRPAARAQRAGALRPAQAIAVVVACLTWTLVSTSTILINKRIMVDLSFHFPAAVAAMGMLGTSVACFFVCAVFKLVPIKATVTPYFYFTRVLPTGFFVALSFQTANTAYLYLSVAFVQMLKAIAPVTTMLCGFAFGLERPTTRLIAAVACICCGVMVSSYGELNFSLIGVAAMLTSVTADGLRTVLMQYLLAAKQFHPLEAWMWLGPACSVWLLALIGATEVHAMRAQHALEIVAAHRWYFLFATAAGFGVNALAMLVIKLGSALTLKVLGIAKDIGLVMFGVLLMGEHVTALELAGYSVSLAGFAWYNLLKMGPSGAAPSAAAEREKEQLQRRKAAKRGGLIGTASCGADGDTAEPLLPVHGSHQRLRVAVRAD